MTDIAEHLIKTSGIDLQQVDMLIEAGIYSSRLEFIRTALSTQLEQHSPSTTHTYPNSKATPAILWRIYG